MLTIHTTQEIKKLLKPFLSTKTIGFVPTMGALHEGHLALIRKAQQENDIVICSIYVNPTQFNNATDLEKYPRTVEQDRQMLEEIGCNYLFLPTDTTMYPEPVHTMLHFGDTEKVLEGKYRAGHFNGVGLIVSKLFHSIKPTKAYFGQKDLQQCVIIKQLVRDYAFDVEIVIVPTVREADGLAMSSRNRRLTAQQRIIAPKIYEGLQMVATMAKTEKSVASIKDAFYNFISNYKEFQIEYFEITDLIYLNSLTEIQKGQEVAISTAIFMGEIRLIDNLIIHI
jgi:pantoate--beta-alanine ligase